jgi:hypothetical protein
MPSVRVSDVRAALTTLLHDDVARVAMNSLVSKGEQAAAPTDIAAASQAVRDAGGAGARVHASDVEERLLQSALRLIGVVNQPSGSGMAFLSKAEVDSVVANDNVLGARVQKAWQIARGGSVDVDAIAKAHAIPAVLGSDEVFMRFATENEASNFVEPNGKHVRWLVVEGETSMTKSFVSGSNDLWSQRFDIDKRTGALTITGEH